MAGHIRRSTDCQLGELYVVFVRFICAVAHWPCQDQDQAEKRPLVLVSGFIHDVDEFLEQHPGGRNMIQRYVGKDATMAFFGGVYDHSNAAHNVSVTHAEHATEG